MHTSLYELGNIRYDTACNCHARVNWTASTKNRLITRCENAAKPSF